MREHGYLTQTYGSVFRSLIFLPFDYIGFHEKEFYFEFLPNSVEDTDIHLQKN
jgi:hypothetical protein